MTRTFEILALLVLALTGSAPAALGSESPITCFTRIASSLLQTETGLELGWIGIYPTNQYTPAVHRLLQVTANIYDATTNRAETGYPHLPSVFRPLFRRDAEGAIFIAGYREVTDASFAMPDTAPPMIDIGDAADRSNIPSMGVPFDPDDHNEPMVGGVPVVVGAKKGFSNFNKFALENGITVTRKLLFRRQPGMPVSHTNQVYLLSISNAFGVQAWNSYSDLFPRALTMVVTCDVNLGLSNELGWVTGPNGLPLTNRFHARVITNIPPETWLGFASPHSHVSFIAPLVSSQTFLTNTAYVRGPGEDAGTFQAKSPSPWEPVNEFRTPDWKLSVRSRIQFALVDTEANRIVDYVNLDGTEESLDIVRIVRGSADCGGDLPTSSDPDPGILWCTNRVGDATTLSAPTFGVWNQIWISMGIPRLVSEAFWRRFNATQTDKQSSIEKFLERMFDNEAPGGLAFEAPFSPTRAVFQYVRWEANDPLVHHSVSHLTDLLGYPDPNSIQWDSNTRTPMRRLWAENPLSDHYRPWGGNPNNPAETPLPTQFNAAVKDPGIFRSGDWDFPSGEPLSLEMLGRVHRGTPWQTVYLKSTEADQHTWWRWTGNSNSLDAWISRPVSDRTVVSLIDAVCSTNHPRLRLSINSHDTNAWLAALDGIFVQTNANDPGVLLSSNAPEAGMIAEAILGTRRAQPGGAFLSLATLLAVPELSFASPWLNTNVDYFNPITDAVYERIPSQLLPRVRADSVGRIATVSGTQRLEFTGYDRFSYSAEASSDLQAWTDLGTWFPTNGVFGSELMPGMATYQFFRSALLP